MHKRSTYVLVYSNILRCSSVCCETEKNQPLFIQHLDQISGKPPFIVSLLNCSGARGNEELCNHVTVPLSSLDKRENGRDGGREGRKGSGGGGGGGGGGMVCKKEARHNYITALILHAKSTSPSLESLLLHTIIRF